MEKDGLVEPIKPEQADGSLPQNSVPRIWGGSGNGAICDACGLVVEKTEIIVEGGSTGASTEHGIRLHVKCFYLWDSLRAVSGS